MAGNPLWYKDAIIYHTHVKAFFDSNNDGMGDFRGLTQKLDYIRDLGATAIWVMPFYPSPMRDDGYDIAEYKNVHPEYGNRRDFRMFVRKAHELGLKVIIELVINHTSDEHPWFQRARKAPKGSARRNFYVWSDTDKKYEDARIIFTDAERSNWAWDEVAQQYYWHRFFSHQPDLNHDNPQVYKAIMGVMRFWLDIGVDGLRLDAIPYLIEREGTDCENLPETHEILKKMRAEMDENYEDRFFLAEANQWPEDVMDYFGDGDECHMAFHFPLMPRIYMAVAQEDRHPIVEIMQQTPDIPDNCQWAIFLRNHDELTLEMVTDKERDYMYQTYATDPRMRINLGIRRRLAPLMDNDRPKIELLNSLLMSMPGTPIIYYGDEIGMGDNIFLGDRDAVRTPMQWTPDRNAGFSRADPARLYLPPIMDPVYGYESVNVEAQSRSQSSLLNWMRRLISVRKAYKAFGRGTLEFLHPGNRKVLAYLREYEDEAILCVANLSRSAQPVELDLSRFRGRVPVELIGGTSFPPVGNLPYFITLPGYSFYWFSLTTEAAAPRWHEELPRVTGLPVLVIPAGRAPARRVREVPLRIPARQIRQLEEEALPEFLSLRRWFAAKGRKIERIELAEQVELGPHWILTLVRVYLGGGNSGAPEEQLYFLPLSAAWEDGKDEVETLEPYTIARLRRRNKVGVLYDALADENFCRRLAAWMGEEREIEIEGGRLRFSRTDAFEDLIGEGELSVRRAGVEQSNTSVILGERLILKGYRRLQEGINPELEIGRFLTEDAGFKNTPPLAGAIEYEPEDGEPTALAVLQGFVQSQGDGWSYAQSYLERRLEEHTVASSWSLEEEQSEEKRDEGEAEDSFFEQLMHTLGLRTGEMHAALATPTDDEAFRAESAPPEEVAGWVEGVLDDLRLTLKLLKKRRDSLPEEARSDADRLLRAEAKIFDRLEAASGVGFGVVKTRHHGDYHLGQVLVVNNDFQIIDFEGEPARSAAERRAKHSPLRDVAGMLRSFNYAAQSALMNAGAEHRERLEEMESWIGLWEQRVRDAFMEGYAEGAEGAASYPENPEHVRLLVDLFTIEKALYEVRYELNNRPDWVGIPIKGILDLVQEPVETEAG